MKNQKIFFLKIAGTAMSSLALICKKEGAKVYGVDDGFYPPVSDLLEKEKIECFQMSEFENILKTNKPDLIIVGNALNGKSKEAEILKNCGIKYYSMPEFIGKFLLFNKNNIVISGTHGKTTTTTMFAETLFLSNKNPSYIVGGIPIFSQKNSHYNPQKNSYFVIEGDEYDTAFFDKGPKFLHYKPNYTIITSIEFDHADIYNSVDEIFENFKKLVEITKKRVILSLDFEYSKKMLEHFDRKLFFTYSIKDKNADLYLEETKVFDGKTTCKFIFENSESGFVTFPFFGLQNVMNLGALIAFLKLENLLLPEILENISKLRGVKRRQELLGTINGGKIYSDFAHHPTAVKLTLEGFKKAFPNKKTIVIFDPATNSNGQNVFEKKYEEIFKNFDKVVIGKPPKAERFSIEKRMNPQRICNNINKEGITKAFYMENVEEIVDFVQKNSSEETVCIVMSNSGFSGFFKRISQFFD